MSKLTTLSSENAIFQWKTNTENNKFSLKTDFFINFFLTFFGVILAPILELWGDQKSSKIIIFQHFSVPKPRPRHTTHPFYKLYASKCVPDPQHVPKRSPECSTNVPQMSPRGLQKLEIWWFGASFAPILRKSPLKTSN